MQQFSNFFDAFSRDFALTLFEERQSVNKIPLQALLRRNEILACAKVHLYVGERKARSDRGERAHL